MELTTSRLFVSPCGNSAVWIHPLDLTNPQYEGWTDCTEMDDEAFERFVVGLRLAN